MTIDELVQVVGRGGEASKDAERAIIALGAQALPALLAAIDGARGRGTHRWSWLIERMPDPAMVPILLAYAQREPRGHSITNIPHWVGRLGGPGVLEWLIGRLEGRYHVFSSAGALGLLGRPEAIAPLLAKLTELVGPSDDFDRVTEALSRWDTEAPHHHLDLCAPRQLVEALAMLGNFERAQLLPTLVRVRRQRRGDRQWLAYRMRAVVGPTTLSDALALLDDRDHELRWNLIQVLFHIGTPDAVRGLCRLARDRRATIVDHAGRRLRELTGTSEPRRALDVVAGLDESLRLHEGRPYDYRARARELRDRFGFLHELWDFELHTGTMFGPRRHFRPESEPNFQAAVDEWVERESDKFEIGGHYRWGHRVPAQSR